jgi:hypothetical protein
MTGGGAKFNLGIFSRAAKLLIKNYPTQVTREFATYPYPENGSKFD